LVRPSAGKIQFLEKEIQKNYPEATQLTSIVSKLQEMNK